MRNIKIEEIMSNLDEIIFLIGNGNRSYLFLTDKRISTIKTSISNLDSILKDFSFMKINYHSIINTKFYVRNNPEGKKEIILKNGIVLKVSREKWKNFYRLT